MRYIAIFTLFSIPVAKGFDTITEAMKCLDQADEDVDSSALGIYDTTLTEVIFYPDENGDVTDGSAKLVTDLARAYVERIA